MNLSQSALSVQIRKLEHQVGHPLFERVAKKLVLTEAGKIALDYADTMFKAGDELMSTLGGRSLASRQVLRVGALTTLSRNFQLEFLRPLVGRPDVELIVRSGSMRDLLAELEAHAIDVVLSNSAAPKDARAHFRNHLLNEQPVSLVGRPRENKRKFRFPDDLRNEPILLPSLDSGIRVGFDHLMDLAGIRPIILAEVDDMAMLRLLAREREGVTLVPPIVVRDELQMGVLVEHYRIPQLSESFYAIVLKRQFPNQLLSGLLTRDAGPKLSLCAN
jgi:LysR family transcriptional activator of nhaA